MPTSAGAVSYERDDGYLVENLLCKYSTIAMTSFIASMRGYCGRCVTAGSPLKVLTPARRLSFGTYLRTSPNHHFSRCTERNDLPD
jgi:hypothetical protein